ncbi:MAG: iron chelate uptake ABC transporter family permease subunit [Pseudonocardiaceae bacterium]
MLGILGRIIITPGQLSVGVITALIGTPYVVWLMWRSGISAAPP